MSFFDRMAVKMKRRDWEKSCGQERVVSARSDVLGCYKDEQ